MKWNESGFRPPLCTYRLNWARRTSWGWWDDWYDTVLQTQDSKFEPWRSEAEHATSRSRRLPTILTFTREWGRNNFVSFKPPRPGTEPRTLAWKAAVLTTTLGPPPSCGKGRGQRPRLFLWLQKQHQGVFWVKTTSIIRSLQQTRIERSLFWICSHVNRHSKKLGNKSNHLHKCWANVPDVGPTFVQMVESVDQVRAATNDTDGV